MQPVVDFIHDLRFEDLPERVVQQAITCVFDLTGVAVAGHSTRLGKIMERFVCEQLPGEVPLLFSQGTASACGAALFGGMLIDSIDAHDGQVLTKGHVGVAILPALLAAAYGRKLDGREFLTALVVGYEIATRAGIALHATAADYHTSGAWNGIAVAAVVARLYRLNRQQTREALGTAEFYGPRSQMMRCIDHPTMVKDGSGWGALAGMSSALLAGAGFTGAPAVTLAGGQVEVIWRDLGRRWYIQEQYFKAYPVCRWAQPAVEAVRQLRPRLTDVGQIQEVHIHTFHEATRLHTVQPSTTEQAQYSLPFSVAAALMDDTIRPQAIAETERGLFHPLRRSLSTKVICHEEARYNERFPAERWAHARIMLNHGEELVSEPAIARGNPENPLSQAELEDKFDSLTLGLLPQDIGQRLKGQVQALPMMDAQALSDYLALFRTPAAIQGS